MAKKKIRLTETQLIELIKKSLIVEQSSGLADTEIQQYAKEIVKLMLGDVTNSDLMKIQAIIEDYIIGQASSRDPKKCALKQLEKFYVISADETNNSFWASTTTGAQGSLLGDIENASVETDSVKEELKKVINDEKSGFCKTLEKPVASTTQNQTTTQQTNNFACVESESTFRAYGTSPNQYGEVQWQGGTLQFYLDARPLGDGAPADNNILYQKGGKKWTTKGSCSEGGPGKQRGLVLGAWTVKTN